MPNMKYLLRCNLLSVRHFVYKLLFHVHLPRFGDILIWINTVVKHRSKYFIFGIQIHIWIGSAYHESIGKVSTYGSKLKFSLSEYFNFLFAYLVITYYSLQYLSNGDTKLKHRSKYFIFGIQIHIWIGSSIYG
jgi:hypothetical protein